MPELNLEALRVAAEKATPGPWRNSWGASNAYIDGPIGSDTVVFRLARDCTKDADAEFCALANPSTILQLIARLEASERDGERYRWLKSGVFDCMHLVDETQMTAKNGQVIYVSMIGPDDIDQIADAAIEVTKEGA